MKELLLAGVVAPTGGCKWLAISTGWSWIAIGARHPLQKHSRLSRKVS
jgi:hypothetical protein